MHFKTCLSMCAAAAASMLFASPASAVDPNLGTVIANPYGVAPYNASYSPNVPIARDRYGNIITATPVDGVQSLSYPTRIAVPGYTVNGGIPVSPIATVGTTTIGPDLRLNPNPGYPGGYPGGYPPPNQQPRWKLGVYSKDTDTGVRIIQVLPGSAGGNAGLEPNDVIISVAGVQVGYVNGHLYDCATEFERSANPDGWVSMLVQDNRSGRIRNLPVRLDSRYSRLTGSIVLNGYQQLPQGAYAVVELQEILRPGAPPVTLQQCRIDSFNGNNVPFAVNFDPQLIDAQRQYVLTGRVMSANQTVYAPRNTVTVLQSNGTPQTVQLAFDPVSGGGAIGPYAQDAQLAQIMQLYQQYLNRQPTYQEQAVWESDLARGTSLNTVKANIFGQNQFFNACNRDEQTYINRLHEINLGRQATPAELAYWTNQYNQSNGVRSQVAQDFLNALAAQNGTRPN